MPIHDPDDYRDGTEEETRPEDRDYTTQQEIHLSGSRIDRLSEEYARLLSRRPRQIGDVLAGRYRITKAIGKGGMGEVFVAEILALGRRVAVKVLQPDLLADASFRRRFQYEADAIASVEHQNVARFLDLVVGDPTFLVMEYVPGPTLAAVLAQQERLAPRRAVDITRRLCWGFGAAHRAGVIHRDIKPSNIILCPDEEFGEQPKIIDFGVAKVETRPSDEQLTLAGQIVGTPHYMSPEQITSGQVDARSDVYSLACVLYHMLTGKPPFEASEQFRILSQHVQQEVTPVSVHVPDAPAALDRVLARALAKDPAARFSSMQEMAQALVSCLDHPAAPATPQLRRRRWQGQLALVGVALALGTVAATWWARGGVARPSSAVFLGSQPAGATVEVDGRRLEDTTPVAIWWNGAGSHAVKLHKDGYGDVERTVTVRGGERTMLEIALPPRSHRVRVKSAPPGATIYLDGQAVVGTTPIAMTVPDDDFHEVRVERAGYETLTYGLKPEDRRSELMLTLEPEKEPRGTLVIDANGAADVWIDGVFTGFTTPTRGLSVPLGEHTVELVAGDAHGPRRRATVQRGETVYVTVPLPDGVK